MVIKDTKELLEMELKTLHNMEDQLVRAIPILVEASTDEKLKDALSSHLDITKLQRDRIEEIGRALDIEVKGKEDEGLTKMLEDGQMTIQSIEDPVLKDAAIMGSTVKVEHHEMGAYFAAMALAKKMGQEDAADLLGESHSEEMEAGKLMETLSKEDVVSNFKKAVM